MSDREAFIVPAGRSTTMRMLSVTGLCESSATECEVGDVTATIAFTRPVPRQPRAYCPWCAKPLRILKATIVQDGFGRPTGETHVR